MYKLTMIRGQIELMPVICNDFLMTCYELGNTDCSSYEIIDIETRTLIQASKEIRK